MNIYMFLFLKIICFGIVYDIVLFHYINPLENYNTRQNIIIIRKLISTRNDLASKDISINYEKFDPCLNFNGRFYYFDKNETAYTFPGIIPIPPPKSIKLNNNTDFFSLIYNYNVFKQLIGKAEEYKPEENNENAKLKADYFIKVDENRGQYSVYE